MREPKHLLLVDGMALLFRAFFATAVHRNYMVNSKGIPTNGVSGMLKHLLSAIDTFSPSHVICCWDMGSKTFRNEMFASYKSNRNEPPLELIPQFELAKQAVSTLNIRNIGIEGYEADDCIGTLAEKFHRDMKVSILTGDRDLLQLLKPNIEVVLLQKGIGNYKVYNDQTFTEEYGISPIGLIDVKGLMGDTSDNYPGVKGIGEKTAYKLIAKYQSIERMLEKLEELTKGQRAKIEAELEMLHLSKKLAAIHCEAPVECEIEKAIFTYEHEKVLMKITELDIKGIINHIVRRGEAI
ncbi:5'-3' exonuclease [Metabacillus arenae]|uniref:5'-3' exonuclease n=1 Tax=Metabacillus arenae TaxID=2771434 RepID=A0A926S244_9BACI|nr:5'-3' exonuclease [Metabacillus arenae]MBD1381634.1 5'-3' exonuclease [Metabacillus arenae]